MSLRVAPYPAYTDADVPWLGPAPAHWSLAPGFSVFREKQRKNSAMLETTVLSLSYGRVVVKDTEKLHGLVPESFETYQIVEPGEIIIRPTDLQNDHVSLRVGAVRDRGIITSAYLCLKTVGEITAEYGYLLLHAYDLKKVFYGMGSGLRQNLDFTDFKRMPVLVPPLAEQYAIAHFIDHADRRINQLIRAKRRLIELLNEQKHAIVHRAVTRGLDPNVRLKPSGIDWLGDVPEHWQLLTAKRVARIFVPQRDKPILTDVGGVPWITPANMRGDRLANSRLFVDLEATDAAEIRIVPASSVVASCVGRFGITAINDVAVVINQQLQAFIPTTHMSSEFLQACVRIAKPYFDRTATITTLAYVDRAGFENMPTLCPPMPEQHRITAFLRDESRVIDSVIARAYRELDLLREYRTRLIADVVTGKLDVRNVKLPQLDVDEPLDDIDAGGDADMIDDGEESGDAD